MVLDTSTYWLTDRQSQCDFDWIKLENWVEFWWVGSPRSLNKKWQEDFIVIRRDSSCVIMRYQETDNADIEKA
jgi:hypothetical protein